jgi:DNA-binding response OmpR family regulator
MTKRKILIVEDDADYREAISFFLQQHNYTVLQAEDGNEGLKLARMERPDLIIMDVMLGERTEGFFTVQEIRRVEELKDVPIFILSALYTRVPGFRVAPEGVWAAHDEFFSKPVEMPFLLEKIRQRIGEAPTASEQTDRPKP